MSIEIRSSEPGKKLKPFMAAGRLVHGKDPNWVSPLDMEVKSRLTPRSNPFFEHAKGQLFTAWKNGQLVGRCSAQVDYEHLRYHKDDAGFFGFFDTIDDQQVADALLAKAEQWLRDNKMKKMRGPYSLSINEEIGLLIDGFDHPPVLMMGHSQPYQAALMDGAGFAKLKDLLAWKWDVRNQLPRRAIRAWEQVDGMPEVRIRTMDKRNIRQELTTMIDIFNDAWSDNWGFVPATRSEVDKMVRDLRLVIDPNLALVVELNGDPVAFCVALPNLNEAIHDFGGKLGVRNTAKLLWRLKVQGVKSARLMLLGIRKELRGVKRYGGLSTALYVEIARRGPPFGYEWGELSWTLEDNHPVNLGIKAMGGKKYKTYRIYEKSIA